MALNSNSTLVVKTGRFYFAPVGTVAPSDLGEIPSAWKEVGHTSVDDILSWATEGGEKTVLASLQSSSLRSTTSARTESFSVSLLQWDKETLPFYFGSNMKLISGSSIFHGVASNPTPVKRALLIVLEDGQNKFAIYAPSAEIARGDDLSIDSTEDLAALPITISLLNHESNDWAFAVTPLSGEAPGEGVEDGADAGTEGP